MVAVTTDRSLRYVGWVAYISAGLSIIGAVTLLLFYALEAPDTFKTGDSSHLIFGPINDYAGLLQFLSMLPLAVALDRLAPTRAQRLSRIAEITGITGMLTAALAQFLLVAHIVTFDVNLPIVLVGMVLIGVWLVVANRLGRAGGALPSRLAFVGVFSGAMFALLGGLTLVFVIANASNPTAVANFGTSLLNNPVLVGAIIVVFSPALVAYIVGVPVWLIGLGRRLLADGADALAQR